MFAQGPQLTESPVEEVRQLDWVPVEVTYYHGSGHRRAPLNVLFVRWVVPKVLQLRGPPRSGYGDQRRTTTRCRTPVGLQSLTRSGDAREDDTPAIVSNAGATGGFGTLRIGSKGSGRPAVQ